MGVACGKDSALLFRHGQVVRKIPASEIVDDLMAEIDRL